MNTLIELKMLHEKIVNGLATDDDKARYDILIESCCIDKEVLVRMLET